MLYSPAMTDGPLLSPTAPPRGRLTAAAAAGIALYGLTMLAAGLDGEHRAITAHEGIYAQPAREMIHTGQWLLPPMAGEPVVHKPPLTHWVVAGFMLAFGSSAEWVCRLPGVLAAIAAALLVADLGSRFHGRRAGLLAGLAMLSSGFVLWKARLCETDTLLTLWVTLAFYAAARGLCDDRARPALRWTLLLWAAAGLSNMTKYGVGVAFIVAGLIAYAAVARDGRALRMLLNPWGWLVAAAIALPWPIAAAAIHEPFLAELRDNILGRASGEYKGSNRPVWTYLYAVPLLLLPWTFWIIGAAVRGAKQGLWSSRLWRLAACWALAGAAGLSVAAFRKEHYVMPVLPPLALLAGWMLEQDTFIRRGRRLPAWLAAGLLAVAAGVGGWAILRYVPALGAAGVVLPAVVAALLIAAVLLDHARRPVGTLASLLLAMWVVGWAMQVHGERHWDGYRPRAALARQVNDLAPPEATVYITGLYRDPIAYYLRFPMRRIESPQAFVDFARERPGRLLHVITSPPALDALSAAGTVTEIARSDPPPHDAGREPVLYCTVAPSAGGR